MNDIQKKILIVDDEKMNIIALGHFLKPKYEIKVAVDGASALEAAAKHLPDIILLDIIMPDMSGFDVLAKLKESKDTMNIPVILISGLHSAENEEKGILLGAVDYIFKPFNKLIVKTKIKMHLKNLDYIRIIEERCMMDVLTGLPNKQGFESRINEDWERALNEKKPLGLLILDIDKFKIYNDTHGHLHGDDLLQEIAKILITTLNRPADFAARQGGKFVVLLPDTGIDEAVNIAKQMWTNIKDTEILCADGTKTSITVSIGAGSTIPGSGGLAADFIASVEKLLLSAKENGEPVCSAAFS
ncbi:MAG: diguanylate cyclase [Treponema sp.]|jgi:diguanylate cyclase (GGDEF)-like protein|nr:diguanylate cyclase [Treponema sp.]